ncbi:MAG: glycosyltransferase [Saprospiraceae bacterium]
MIILFKFLFYFSIFFIFYTYLIFPIGVFILYNFKKKIKNKKYYLANELPHVSCLISIYNEEKIIEQKIISLLNSNYPKDKLHIYIGSDNSNDQSNAIVKKLAEFEKNIHFFPYQHRQGKASVINELMLEIIQHQSIDSEHIILCTDANVLLEPNTIYNLCRNYKDPKIGLVDTRMIPGNLKAIDISQSENNYIQLETQLKHWEGELWGCMMGAFGGCYTVRSNLMEKIPGHVIVDDFYISMKVLEAGFSCINDLEAIANEAIPGTITEEYRRKSRISAGNFQNLAIFNHLLWSKPIVVAICFLSHKVIRWISPILFITTIISSAFLAWNSNPYFTWIFIILILIFGLTPIIDKIFSRIGINLQFLRNISYFAWMNLAVLSGFIKYCKGIKTSIWQPTLRK